MSEIEFQLQPEIVDLARQQAKEQGKPLALYLSHIVSATVTGREAQNQRAAEMWRELHAVA